MGQLTTLFDVGRKDNKDMIASIFDKSMLMTPSVR